ncbi:MAG: chloride channel protein [Phycisphaeraceae bacterium]|nr:chloride channel protein [Phycisphaeraceae bacterium]
MGRTGAQTESSSGPSERGEMMRTLALSVLIGAGTGIIGTLFHRSVDACESLRGWLLDRLHAGEGAAWVGGFGWAVLPAIGLAAGCGIGLMVTRLAPDSGGSGIPAIKEILAGTRRVMSRLMIPVKFIGGAVGIGLGLSAGREGPTIQMGAGLAHVLGGRLADDAVVRRTLLAGGAGAGLTAAFGAPLAGFIFVVEELRVPLRRGVFVGVLAATIASGAACRAMGGSVYFETPEVAAIPLSAWPAVVLVGIAAGLVGVAYSGTVLAGVRLARQSRLAPAWMLPGLAAGVMGLVAWYSPALVGDGHGFTQSLLQPGGVGRAAWVLLVMLAARLVLTAMTYSSGTPGGLFAPILALGAMLGQGVWVLADSSGAGGVWGFAGADGRSLAMVAMAAIFAGSIRSTITGVVLMVEMTGCWALIPAMSAASLSAHVVAMLLRSEPVYDSLMEMDLAADRAAGGARA